MKRIEAKIADPELGDLKTLIRYGTYDQKTPFIIKSSRSRLYRIITKKKASKENILCLVDDKSVKINSLYKNEIHKEEIAKWADRIGKMSFEYKASDFDVNVAKSGAADSPTWRLNKKPAAVTAPKLSMTEALQQITEQDRMVISRRSTFSSVFDHLW